MQDTRLLLPVNDSLQYMFALAEWQGEVKFGGYRNFYKVMGRLPYIYERNRVPPMMGAAAGSWTFPDASRTYLLDGSFDVDSDTFKCALLLSTSNVGSSTTTYVGLTNEVAAAFGYSTGGISITLTLAGTTTVTVDISTDPVWTASGGSIVARFAVIYEVGGKVMCYALLDSAPANVTATDGNTLTVAANASGVFTLA